MYSSSNIKRVPSCRVIARMLQRQQQNLNHHHLQRYRTITATTVVTDHNLYGDCRRVCMLATSADTPQRFVMVHPSSFHRKKSQFASTLTLSSSSSFLSSLLKSRQFSSSSHDATMVALIQERFNTLMNDDGLLELYEPSVRQQMWQSVWKRQTTDKTIQDSSVSSTNETTSHGVTTIIGDEHDTTQRTAAVLVLLVRVNETELSVVLTRRSKHLSHHAHQISFPGGHYDADHDTTMVDTAIREAVEELYGSDNTNNNNSNNNGSLDSSPTTIDSTEQDYLRHYEQFRQNLHVFGCTTSLPSLMGTPVTPVLAMYSVRTNDTSGILTPEKISQMWPGNRSEVEIVFTIPIQTLIEQQQEPSKQLTEPTFDRFQTHKSSNIKNATQYTTSYGTIWGLTAYILQPIVDALFIPVFSKTIGTTKQ
jgi:NUDIX domain